MKTFKGKNFRQKLLISIVCAILLNFCFTYNVSYGIGVAIDAAESFGGEIMPIIRDFARGIADVFGSIVQLGLTGKWIPATDRAGTGDPSITDEYWIKRNYFKYPILQVSPEVILAGKVQMLDVNFIKPVQEDTEGKYILKFDTDALNQLREIIASWYVTLRTIAIVRITFSINISRY